MGNKRRIVIDEIQGGWTVTLTEGESVFPSTFYPSSRLAVARVLQLLNCGPVGPQMHPERVCISDTEAPHE